MKTPSALLFDFGGTIDLPGSHWLDRFLANYRRAGVVITREELDPAFACGTDAGYGAGPAMRERGLGELVRFLVDAQLDYLSSRGPEPVRAQVRAADGGRDALAEKISAGFVEETNRGLASSREVLTTLARDFRLGVISNFYGNLDRILAQARMGELFEIVIDSTRVNLFKPDPRIFEAALTAFALPAAQVAIVGDSLDKDCLPARRLGMRAVWLRTSSDGRAIREADASLVDHIISELRELTELRW
ncbi:MAG: HAD family hydrolase [Candidatus Binataceae bacterium]